MSQWEVLSNKSDNIVMPPGILLSEIGWRHIKTLDIEFTSTWDRVDIFEGPDRREGRRVLERWFHAHDVRQRVKILLPFSHFVLTIFPHRITADLVPPSIMQESQWRREDHAVNNGDNEDDGDGDGQRNYIYRGDSATRWTAWNELHEWCYYQSEVGLYEKRPVDYYHRRFIQLILTNPNAEMGVYDGVGDYQLIDFNKYNHTWNYQGPDDQASFDEALEQLNLTSYTGYIFPGRIVEAPIERIRLSGDTTGLPPDLGHGWLLSPDRREYRGPDRAVGMALLRQWKQHASFSHLGRRSRHVQRETSDSNHNTRRHRHVHHDTNDDVDVRPQLQLVHTNVGRGGPPINDDQEIVHCPMCNRNIPACFYRGHQIVCIPFPVNKGLGPFNPFNPPA
eukprot:GILJ01015688.1.p1 GENE.GILJ01015688.1~~GILJ01015688.1.p1  ORF type:complete len:393 (+),score=2.13 GILJ01015688.1:426-1604(+)